jgi:transposase
MQGKKKFEAKIYYGINLDEIVPSDHLLRKLDKLISFEFVRDKTKRYYSHTGKPSVDPTVLVKMLVIGYLYDIRSERRLVEDVSLNLAYRWYVGYDIDERVPDHSIFTKARKRFGKKLFVQIFEEVLSKCIQAQIVLGKEVLMDSTLIKADASMNSIIDVTLSPEQYWRKLEESEVPTGPRGRKPKEGGPTHVGSHFKDNKIDPGKMGKRMRNANAKYLKKRSTTDPDATLYFRPGMGSMLSYKAHIAADPGGIITAVAVSPSATHDSARAPELLRQHEKLLGAPAWATADSKYGSQECLGYLQAKGIKTAIKPASTTNCQ